MIKSIKELWFSLKKKEKDYLKVGFLVIILISIISIIILPLLLTWESISFLNFNNTGGIGDTINGIAAPFIAIFAATLTFLAFYVQFSANQIQKKDFKQSVKTARLERFETRFFELIRFQRDNVNEMELDEKMGRRVFVTMIREFREVHIFVKKVAVEMNENFDHKTLISIAYYAFYIGVGPNSSRSLRETLTHKYSSAFVDRLITVLSSSTNQKAVSEKRNFKFRPFAGHFSRLGHYYRHLYQIVKYVDDQNIKINKKKEYVKTLRAQLTIHEQALFYLNSLCPLGQVWWDEKLITDYSLVKNIPKGFFDLTEEINIYRDFDSGYFEWQEIENLSLNKNPMNLTKDDLNKIIESLTYSIKAVEDSTEHPTADFKKKRVDEFKNVLKKVKDMNDGSSK